MSAGPHPWAGGGGGGAGRRARAGRGARQGRGPRVVALGGGHGLYASLSALRLVTDELTAVVTVADNGGSSGRLRSEFGVLPPGDLRMALAALCEDSRWGTLWRDVLQHRFTGAGPLEGHAVGNLLITALWQLLEDPVTGLDVVGELLGARGRVLPMSRVPLDIEADVRAEVTDGTGVLRTISGQVQVAAAAGRVEAVRLLPADPPADPVAVDAVLDADWVVLGPGSWFTSVLPHVLVPDLADALTATSARRCVTLNIAPSVGETSGFSGEALLEVLAGYAPDMAIDAVVADPGAISDIDALDRVVGSLGARLLLRQVSVGDGSARHDALRLAAAYGDVFAGALSDVSDAMGLRRGGQTGVVPRAVGRDVPHGDTAPMRRPDAADDAAGSDPTGSDPTGSDDHSRDFVR